MAIGDTIQEWKNNTCYQQGEIVTYEGRFFKSILTLDKITYPPDKSRLWKEITPVPVQRQIWTQGNRYIKGEIVTYQGKEYVAKRNIDNAAYPPNRSENWSELYPEPLTTKELLTKVCEAFDELTAGEAYENLDALSIKDLTEWWAANKPKTEKERLKERVTSILDNMIESYKRDINVDTSVAAKNILNLLGK